MITRARLRGEPAGDPAARVAGLPVLLRQLLSLQDAGITEVTLERPWLVPADPRLKLRISVAALQTPRPDRADAEPLLSARPGLVWHPNLPSRLAAAGRSADIEQATLLDGEFVVPAATAAERAAAERLLLGTLHKPTDGMISRAVNRHLSLAVSRLLLDTPITPNQMTLIAAVFGLSGVAVVLAGGAAALIPGALLVQVQSILDGCDGEISRLKYLRSRSGEWLDQVFDDVVNVGFFAAAGWALWREGSAFAGWLALVGTVAHLIYQVALYAALLTRAGGSGSTARLLWWGQTPVGAPAAPRAAHPLQRVKEFIELAGRRDFFTFLYVPAALTGTTVVALVWAGIIFIVSGVATGLQWLVAGGPRSA